MKGPRLAVAGRLAVALLALAHPASAQRLRLGLEAVGLTSVEGSETASALGGGLGGFLEAGWGRVALDARVFAASLDPDSAQRANYDVLQGDIRLRYAVSSVVALEAGVGRRSVSPRFAAQEIGLVRIGVFSENHITRTASIWVRGAYLPVTGFTGGGSASLSVELGLGVAIGTSNGRFRARAEYEFQRIDRAVDGLDVPLQTSLGRFGVAIRVF